MRDNAFNFMPSFHYKAVDQLGRPALGQIDALNDIDLEVRLGSMGLDLISFRLVKPSIKWFRRRQVSHRDLLLFCFQLEQLTSAGVPLLTSLKDLQTSNQSALFQTTLSAVYAEVEGGKMLSQALAKHPQVFNEIFVSLIAAGEKTGQLPAVLNHLFHTLRWQDELLAQTKKLLAYPIFVAVVVLAAAVFLMTYLVPQMVPFLRSMGQALPLNTKILIAMSNAFIHYWWLVIGLPVLVLMGLVSWVQRSVWARYRFDSLKLNLPMAGSILQKMMMARFARYFALMYQAGIPILEAIKMCEHIVGNRVVADALGRVQVQINAGQAMSESFHNAGLFPPMVVRMIRVGESTGALDKALFNISYFYDRDVNDAMQNMLKMLEPTLTVILGLMLAFIMLSVLGPVYSSLNQLKI